jgi:hypothetical protein
VKYFIGGSVGNIYWKFLEMFQERDMHMELIICENSFHGMHPVVYLLDNIYLSIGQSTQQLLQ